MRKKWIRVFPVILILALAAPLLMGAAPATPHVTDLRIQMPGDPGAERPVQTIYLSDGKKAKGLIQGNGVKIRSGESSENADFLWTITEEGDFQLTLLRPSRGEFTFLDTEGNAYTITYWAEEPVIKPEKNYNSENPIEKIVFVFEPVVEPREESYTG